MENILLFDTLSTKIGLKPFSDTRPLATIRIGINTIEEKWKTFIPGTYSYLTDAYLRHKFACLSKTTNLYINGSICPNKTLVDAIQHIGPQEMLVQGDTIIAFWGEQISTPSPHTDTFSKLRDHAKTIPFHETIMQLKNKWDIFLHNSEAIREDFAQLRANKVTQQVNDPHTIFYNPQDVFIEEGAKIKAAILNAEEGPIYIGRNAVIEERAIIKGPVAICEGAQVKAGSRIYPGTTVGPYAKIGGEVTNSVIFEYSNKAHEGFLGHSVIGEWCNLGSHTNTSNLRNDYKEVTVWNEAQSDFTKTNLQFCGLFMGPYSKCGINSMFNTATVVGVCTNLYGTGYFKRYIPSFTKGSPSDHLFPYNLEDALISIENTMARRNKTLTEIDRKLLTNLSEAAMSIWIKSVI
jgi:UDP-N-acetylglucosamine diphosphorylase/glucosamine-1-phosphate N-acetyltransferase